MTIEWDEERFGSGFPEIDAQHRQLFARINMLTTSIEKHPGAKGEASRLLYFLEDYVHEHFGCEEDIMERHRCASCVRNKAEHAHFVKQLQELRMTFEREGISRGFVDRLQTQVVDWIQNHVAGVDTGLKSVST